MNVDTPDARMRTREETSNRCVASTTKSRLLVIYLFVYILSPRTNLDLENYYGD